MSQLAFVYVVSPVQMFLTPSANAVRPSSTDPWEMAISGMSSLNISWNFNSRFRLALNLVASEVGLYFPTILNCSPSTFITSMVSGCSLVVNIMWCPSNLRRLAIACPYRTCFLVGRKFHYPFPVHASYQIFISSSHSFLVSIWRFNINSTALIFNHNVNRANTDMKVENATIDETTNTSLRSVEGL